MILHWPQITVIVMFAMGFAINLERHGKPKTDNYSVGISIVSIFINIVLLYCGGFFG